MACVYVYPRHRGRRCGQQGCRLHLKASQHHVSIFVGSHKHVDLDDLLDCVSRSLKNGIDKESICLAMSWIYDVIELKKYMHNIGYNVNGSKAFMARLLVTFYSAIASLQENQGFVRALIYIQKLWRRHRLHGPVKEAKNSTDPFTLTSITDLPPNEVFAYRDKCGLVWAFSANDMSHYVSNTPINPYTRDTIETRDLFRLADIVKMLPSTEPHNVSLDTCATIDQMYTHAIGYYDDFYLQNWYFTSLSIQDLQSISTSIPQCIPTDPISTHREFAGFMISVAGSPPDVRFGRMCLLVTRIAQHIDGLYDSLPEWISAAAATASRRRRTLRESH